MPSALAISKKVAVLGLLYRLYIFNFDWRAILCSRLSFGVTVPMVHRLGPQWVQGRSRAVPWAWGLIPSVLHRGWRLFRLGVLVTVALKQKKWYRNLGLFRYLCIYMEWYGHWNTTGEGKQRHCDGDPKDHLSSVFSFQLSDACCNTELAYPFAQ